MHGQKVGNVFHIRDLLLVDALAGVVWCRVRGTYSNM